MLVDLVTYGQIALYKGYQFIMPSPTFKYTTFIIAYSLIFVIIQDGILKQKLLEQIVLLFFLLNQIKLGPLIISFPGF